MANLRRKKADIEFSLMIRERDRWTCQRCGARHLPKSRGLHAAHVFTRSIKATRHDPMNVYALCYGCHSHLHKHPDEAREFWKQHIGEAEYESLRQKAMKVGK